MKLSIRRFHFLALVLAFVFAAPAAAAAAEAADEIQVPEEIENKVLTAINNGDIDGQDTAIQELVGFIDKTSLAYDEKRGFLKKYLVLLGLPPDEAGNTSLIYYPPIVEETEPEPMEREKPICPDEKDPSPC